RRADGRSGSAQRGDRLRCRAAAPEGANDARDRTPSGACRACRLRGWPHPWCRGPRGGQVGGMSRTLLALLRFENAPRSRIALGSALGALTVMFGVGLMATAGYLISRAAERPAILSLMVAIVGVRFFGLGRPILRYLERLASHDLALRVLGRVRVRFFQRIEPL